MKEFFNAFKTGLGLIPSCLFCFVKKLIVNFTVYAFISSIPMTVAFGVWYLLATFAPNAASVVFKILATIGQIIPLSFSLYVSEWELIETDEDSAELCFAICALFIAVIWIKL